METEQWSLVINALVAFGTIALAGIAFVTILQAIRDRSNRRLEDIISWATDVGGFRVEFGADVVSRLQGPGGDAYLEIQVGAAVDKITDLSRKSQYISSMAKNFNTALQTALEELIKELIAHKGLLQKWHHGLLEAVREPSPDKSKALVSLAIETGSHEYLLGQYADKVIIEATGTKAGA
jgi:hypothetical protein